MLFHLASTHFFNRLSGPLILILYFGHNCFFALEIILLFSRQIRRIIRIKSYLLLRWIWIWYSFVQPVSSVPSNGCANDIPQESILL